MLHQYARNKAIIIIGGIAMVILGFAIFLNPIAAVQNLIRIIGWVFIGISIVAIATTILSGRLQDEIPLVVVGALFLVAGIGMAAWPGFFVKTVWTILGIVILITGILDIVEAADMRSMGSPVAGPAKVSGVLTALLGVVCIISPMLMPELGMLVTGVSLLIDGVTEVIFGLGL